MLLRMKSIILVFITFSMLILFPVFSHGQTSTAQTHTVSRGETLYGIAEKYKLKLKELRSLNLNLKGDLIHPGDILIVSKPEMEAQPLANSVSGLPRRSAEDGQLPTDWEETHLEMLFEDRDKQYGDYQVYEFNKTEDTREVMPRGNERKYIYHTVAPGESVYTIAKKYGVKAEDIIDLNNKEIVATGDKLFIPVQLGSDSSSTSEEKSARQTASLRKDSRHQEIVPDASLQMEQGYYQAVRINGVNEVFYALHPSLPRGTKIKIQIPGNAGYIEATIVGPFVTKSDKMIGLSPRIDEILSLAGSKPRITIYY